MSVYQIETTGGTYQIETADAAPEQPAAVQQAMQYADSGGKGAPPPIPTQGKVPYALKKQEFDDHPLQASPILPSAMAGIGAGMGMLNAIGDKLGLNIADKARAKGGQVLGGPIAPRPAGLLAEGTEIPTLGQSIGQGVKDAFPSKQRAGLLYDQVGKAVGESPVDLSAARKTALEMKEMASDGGSGLPRVARAVLRRTEENGQVPWDSARRMASNSGRLSAGEMMNLNPAMRAKVAQLASDLSKANAAAAEQAGVGQQYQTAMKGYRQAAQLGAIKDAAKGIAKDKVVRGGIGLLGIDAIGKKLGLL